MKIMEISRSKLRTLGIDWAQFSSGDFVTSSIGGLITKGTTTASLARTTGSFTTTGTETMQFGVLESNASFFSFIQALQQNLLVKVLAEPTLVAVSGRPAYFMDGGKVPYPVVSGLGSVNVAFQDYGTQVDFVPIILGNGYVRLEVRPSVSEIDNSVAVTLNGTTVPGFTTRTVDTGVELKMGQTLALAGLIQQRVESTRNAVPVLGDVPLVGALFRRMTDTQNEIELLVLVRPELAEAMDCDQVPPTGPGENSENTSDYNFYINGQIEQPPQPRGAGRDHSGGLNGLSAEGVGGFTTAPYAAGPTCEGPPAPGGLMTPLGGTMGAAGGGMAGPPNTGFVAPVYTPPGANPAGPGYYAPPPQSSPAPEQVPPGSPPRAPANSLPTPGSASSSPPTAPTLGSPGGASPMLGAPATRNGMLAPPPTSPPATGSPAAGSATDSAGAGSGATASARRLAARPPRTSAAAPAAQGGAPTGRYTPPAATSGTYKPPQANNPQPPPKNSDPNELPGFIGSSGYDVTN